jgi:ParB-like chromosome segregation protein Spo0J
MKVLQDWHDRQEDASMAEQAHVRGKVVTFALDKLKPNGWNPNVVTPEKMASIEYGFRTDGWLASQALLVWRKDDKGKTQNVIVDGEHRWKAARNVGLAEGPVVFLDGVSETEAKALTIKLNQKRGEWDEDALGKLLREVQASSEDLGLDFGFDGAELERLLAVSSVQDPATAPPQAGAGAQRTPADVAPPEDFPDLSAPGAVKTDHKCPRCAYEWSGAAK